MPRPTPDQAREQAEAYVNNPEVEKLWNVQERINEIDLSADANDLQHGRVPTDNE